MAISIQCAKCRAQYRVDDKLAGKRVKCKGCGETILVSAGEGDSGGAADADLLTLAKQLSAEPAGRGAGRSAADAGGTKCPMCETAVAAGSVLCLNCGYNFRTKRGGTAREIPLATEAEAEFKKTPRRRRAGPEIFETLDRYLGVGVILLVAAGLSVWITHVLKGSTGFSVNLVLPVAVVMGLLLVVMGPLMWLAIRVAGQMLKWEPRADGYQRVLVVLFLPLGAALLCGGQDDALASAVMSGSWVVAPLLYLYLFRAEAMEWIATGVAGLAGGIVGWVVMGLVGMLVPLASGPLYADALPPGPWVALATGHSPVPAKPAPLASATETRPAVVAVTPVTPEPAPAPDTVATTPPAEVVPDTTAKTDASSPTPEIKPPTVAPPVVSKAPEPAHEFKPIKSPFVTEVTSDASWIEGTHEVIPSLTPSPWLLVVKRGNDGQTACQRWSPTANKGELTFQELPRDPNSYMLSPKGDYLVVLTRFPKWQLEVWLFDSKTSMRRFFLTDSLPDYEKSAVPHLVGFLDAGHFIVRWELGGRQVFYLMQVSSNDPYRKIVVEPYESGPNGMTVSGDGRSIAVMSTATGPTKRVLIYDTGTGAVKRISPMEMDFTNQGMAFSPDGKKLAVYTSTKDGDMVITFGLTKCDILSTAFMPVKAGGDMGAAAPHGLIWLRGPALWLVDGTDFCEVDGGKKVGSLRVSSLLETRMMGEDMLLVEQATDDDPLKPSVIRLDNAALQKAMDALRKH